MTTFENWKPHRLSTVLIIGANSLLAPLTSAHLRSCAAYIDGICIGYFADRKTAETACQDITGLKI